MPAHVSRLAIRVNMPHMRYKQNQMGWNVRDCQGAVCKLRQGQPQTLEPVADAIPLLVREDDSTQYIHSPYTIAASFIVYSTYHATCRKTFPV